MTGLAVALASIFGLPGDGQMGQPLACGGVLTPSTVGVANRVLPCRSWVTLCHRRCIRVRVVDRGPYVSGRDFDLTPRTARMLHCPDLCRVHWRRAK